MVRFLPANIARLVTIALQAPLHQDGAAPATVGVTNIGMPPAMSAVPPAVPPAVPTGYRSSSRATVERDMDTGKPPIWKRMLAKMPLLKTRKGVKKGEMPARREEMNKYQYGVRTAEDERVPAKEALEKLMDGNTRFLEGKSLVMKGWNQENRVALAEYGQAPMASVLGCADSRVPVELLFDVLPGDIFVLRNAGNTLSNAEGSMVGSLEYSVNVLGMKLVVVLGHTECGAINGATDMMLNEQTSGATETETALERLLRGLNPVVQQAQLELGEGASEKDIATVAVTVNVFEGIQKILDFSPSIADKVESGEVELHGAVYDISTGKVSFLGQHPRLPEILSYLKEGEEEEAEAEE